MIHDCHPSRQTGRKGKTRRTQDPFDTVNNDDAQRTLVRVREDLVQVCDLLRLAEADHILRRDELDEGVLGGEGDGSGESGLSGTGGTYGEKE